MHDTNKIISLDNHLTLPSFMAVVKERYLVQLSSQYQIRVNASRQLIDQWLSENKVMYGVTTGFGALCSTKISIEDAAILQKNLILSHATSVGEPMEEDYVRGIMLMVLQNIGQGYSGVRLTVLQRYVDMLNHGVIPYVPQDGSVGYLSIEAHIAMTLFGEGRVLYQNEYLPTAQVLKILNWNPIQLQAKEGLALISGTTSATALAAINIHYLQELAKTADVIGALTLETLCGNLQAFDDRVMSVRPHSEQAQTARNVRNILSDSAWMKENAPQHLQDALSLRCIPQLHGAAKKLFNDAQKTIEIEINACCDNPIIWSDGVDAEILSACNADSSYIGMAMDSIAIAATNLAKMSERRNNRLLDPISSGLPAFLVKESGLNSGLMIPQYTQAALLNEMRMLSTPATIDNTPTCNNQEDYVAMGYNASKKAALLTKKLQYVLAIELLSIVTAQQFMNDSQPRSSVTKKICQYISDELPMIKTDVYLAEYIEKIRQLIHEGQVVQCAELIVGKLN